jgi:hypothetical protein
VCDTYTEVVLMKDQTLQGSWGSMFLDLLKFDKVLNLISQMSDTGTILGLVYGV